MTAAEREVRAKRDGCTPDAACTLDALPIRVMQGAGHFQIRCDHCEAIWLDYKTPRRQIADRYRRCLIARDPQDDERR